MPDPQTHREDSLAERAFVDLRQAVDNLPGSRLLLLIDPALADPLAEEVLPADMTALPNRVSLNIGFIPRDRQPYLVELSGGIGGEILLSKTVHIAVRERLGCYDLHGDDDADEGGDPAEVRSVCAWLFADAGSLDLPVLAYRLARCCVRSPLDGERTAFRYWDPRLTPHLPRIFGADAWTGRLAALGLHAWYCLDDDGQAHRFAATPAALAPTEPMPLWNLDEERGLALARIHWTKRARQLLPQWDGVPAGIGRDTVAALVERTAHHGLRSEADVLRFVHSALVLHPRFDSHPQVAAALADLKVQGSRPGAFARLAQQWNDDFRHILRDGRWLDDGDRGQTQA